MLLGLAQWIACFGMILFAAQGACAGEVRVGVLSTAGIQEHASPIESVATEVGLAGARLATADNASTGRFVGLRFELLENVLSSGEDPEVGFDQLVARGAQWIVANLMAQDLRRILSRRQGDRPLIINSGAPDDDLRTGVCSGLLHTIPSRSMTADALAQYLVTLNWRRWFLVIGRKPPDQLMADAYRRAAKRFGADIVVEKEWSFQPGHGRADTGHVALQSEIPVFTRVADHDVLVVADETDEFGEYLFGRTHRPRPVAGTHGILATAFHQTNEQWGAAQLHARFEKQNGRRMGPVDYAAWLAVRAVGEAALRSRATESEGIDQYMRGPDFQLGGYKGTAHSFRPWDGQMRQPVLIAGPRMLLSASPQPGFIHQMTALDTLGTSQREMQCDASH
jgi:ABC transporter substrate binding protein (PQQ-dependent alcohol dehydrogenase system)